MPTSVRLFFWLTAPWGVLAVGCGQAEPVVEIDTRLPCFESHCIDHDFCTEDRCLPSGECVFVPNNPELACQTDLHCDSENPCVTGRCKLDRCDNLRCEFTEASGCRPCGPLFGHCDDGNPCTAERCDEASGMCIFGVEVEGCDRRCSVSGAVRVIDAAWVHPGFEGAFRGRVGVADFGCDGGCECDKPARLVEDISAIALEAAPGVEPRTCRVSSCGGALDVDCGPFAYGREYVIWGLGSWRDPASAKDSIPPRPEPDAGGAPMPQGVNALRVDGFCPSTALGDGALLGPWAGVYESGGLIAELQLSLRLVEGSWVSAEAVVVGCLGCAAVGLGQGRMTVDVTEPGLLLGFEVDGRPALARVLGREGRLTGDVLRDDGSFVGILTLTPLPNP